VWFGGRCSPANGRGVVDQRPGCASNDRPGVTCAVTHVPHGWEAGLVFDETTGTLFCGDLFTRWGRYPATTTDDVLGPALAADVEADFGSWSLRPDSGAIVRQLAELDITTLAPMHGPAFTGDCPAALHGLADAVDTRIAG
jgi:hypothetical protein